MRACLIAVIVSWGAQAVAQTPSSSTAREKFERGTTLYDLGRYLDAAKAYEEAYTLKNDPALLFNVGQAYRLGGDYTQALRAYRAFLRRMPDTKARPDVERHIANLQRLVEEQKKASSSPPMGTFSPGQLQYGPESPPPREPPTASTPPPGATASVGAQREAPAKTPVYKKWWLWTAVGGVVVAGLVVGLAVAYTTPNDAARPAGASGVTFP